MTYLIWSIINGIIFLYFLYLIVGFIAKGKRIFKPQFKYVSIFIMIIGITQIISASNRDKPNNRIIITEGYNNNSKVKRILLEDNLAFDINLSLKYSVDENEFIPISSNSSLTGFISGYVWDFKTIETKNNSKTKQLEFTANGILQWKLFGIDVYAQYKTFNGIIE